MNVHTHAALTDQGVVSGRAGETLRYRASLGSDVRILADVAVKHAAPLADLPLEQLARETAERGPGGVLRKVWVVKNGAEVFRDSDATVVDVRLSQHAKAYHFGSVGTDLIAIGDKPAKSDCTHFGFIRSGDVIVWDTDQALRFVGSGPDAYVDLYRDEGLADKIGEATVEGPSDPTVMPFPMKSMFST